MIYVSQPYLNGAELENVSSAVKEGAITGNFGSYINEFEEGFASYCGSQYGVAVSSGTTALHLAMILLDIGPGDEVLVSSYTNMATFFAVLYVGAKPIPIDIDPVSWNINPSLIESKISDKTKAIIVVHIFGQSADMDPILDIAQRNNLYVVEDCAQAHGAEYKSRKTGSMGDVGCFSFYGNKIITTGEGGMLTLNNSKLADRAKSLRSLAFGVENKFMHLEIGYNYRMTNMQAAIGCAQLAKIEEIIDKKRAIANFYYNELKNIKSLNFPVEMKNNKSVYWMYHIVLNESAKISRDELISKLATLDIETREGFAPFNDQKSIESAKEFEGQCPVASYIGERSLYLPSGPGMMESELKYVCDKVIEILK